MNYLGLLKMAKFQQIDNWIVEDNRFSLKYEKYDICIECIDNNIICSIIKNSNKLDFNFPNFEKAFEFVNKFIDQKNFDKKADKKANTFRISNDLKNKLTKIYNS